MRVSRSSSGELKVGTTCNKLGSHTSSIQYEAHMSRCNNRRLCDKSYLHPMLMSFHIPKAPWTLGVFPSGGFELVPAVRAGSNPRHYISFLDLFNLTHLAHLTNRYLL